MQLRHISPRSSDWMDAMDEGGGGRWWEKLAPEEREKLLRERREASGSSRAAATRAGAGRVCERRGSGLGADVGLEIGDEELGGAVLCAPSVARVRDVVHEDREHERQVTRRAGEPR